MAAVDLVVPVFNEASEIEGFLDALAAQTEFDGRPLADGRLRVIAVDNGSDDGTRELLARAARRTRPALVVLDEPVKSHIQARICGADFAAGDAACRPILASADADTRLHPRFVASVTRLIDAGFDAVSCGGTFPDAFWRLVPELARRYHDEIGTIFFPPATIARLGGERRPERFSARLFRDLGRMPSDCAFAVTKAAFVDAGGYRREWWPDGRELLGEGWNLKFRLDQRGARLAYLDDAPYETSPRRLLHEAEELLAGSAYRDGMSDLRAPTGAREHALLEAMAGTMDFAALRRYVVRNYIVLQAITRPAEVERFRPWLGPATDETFAAIRAAAPRSSADIHQLADQLAPRVADDVVAQADSLTADPSGASSA